MTEKARLCRAFFMLFSLHFFLGLRLFFFVFHHLLLFLPCIAAAARRGRRVACPARGMG